MKKTEVNTLVREIIDFSNDSVAREVAGFISHDNEAVRLTRAQAEAVIQAVNNIVRESAFSILSRN